MKLCEACNRQVITGVPGHVFLYNAQLKRYVHYHQECFELDIELELKLA